MGTSNVGSFTAAIYNWSQCNANIASTKNQYQDWVAHILSAIRSDPKSAGHMSPAAALWMFQTEIIPLATQNCEYQAEQQAAALNIANGIRTVITGAQTSFNNWLTNKAANQPGGQQNISLALSGLNQLKADLKVKGVTAVFTTTMRNNLSQMANGLFNNMDPKGNAQADNSYMSKLYNQAITSSTGTGSGSAYHVIGGPIPPFFNQVTTSFNNLNQSVSGISSSISTQMQYLQQSLQQYFAVYKNFFDDFSNLTSFILNKTGGS